MSRVSFTSTFTPLTTSDITRLPGQQATASATVSTPATAPVASVNVKTYETYEEPKNSHAFLKTIIALAALAGGIVALKRFKIIKPVIKSDDMKFMDKVKYYILKAADGIEYPFVKLIDHFKKGKAAAENSG